MMNQFNEIDLTNTHLVNMIQMAETVLFDGFLIAESGTPAEHYIDPRTTRNPDGMPVVKPIAESRLFFWYICPFCQEIHIESKRLLNRDQRVLPANCLYRVQIKHEFQIDMAADPLAYQEVPDQALHDEWMIMNDFAASLKGPKESW